MIDKTKLEQLLRIKTMLCVGSIILGYGLIALSPLAWRPGIAYTTKEVIILAIPWIIFIGSVVPLTTLHNFIARKYHG